MGRKVWALAAACAVSTVVCVGAAGAALVSAKPAPSAQTDGRVNALYVSGAKVYVGGQFTTVRGAGASSGGATRNRVAQIDLSTGEVQSWNPNANSTVQTIASGAGLVFLGGNFTTLGGQTAQRLAAVDPATGALVWKATLNGQVMAIDVANGLVYAGGYFTTANGASRPYLAAFDEQTGVLDTRWTPTANLEVKALAVSADGTRVYVGGDFGQLNGAAAAHLGAVSATTGASLAWASHPAYQVIDMDVAGGDVYVAGAGGGGNFARFDGATGASDWIGGTNGNIQAIAVIDDIVYVGGHFSAYCGHVAGSDTCPGGSTRQKLLALDADTGNLQPWNPGANSDLGIYSLADGGAGCWQAATSPAPARPISRGSRDSRRWPATPALRASPRRRRWRSPRASRSARRRFPRTSAGQRPIQVACAGTR